MQALKKELRLLVPSLKVFLDGEQALVHSCRSNPYARFHTNRHTVENLTSIADLEALIGNSEVVLIFLSSGCKYRETFFHAPINKPVFLRRLPALELPA